MDESIQTDPSTALGMTTEFHIPPSFLPFGQDKVNVDSDPHVRGLHRVIRRKNPNRARNLEILLKNCVTGCKCLRIADLLLARIAVRRYH